MKWHFITSVLFAVVYAMQVLIPDKFMRMKLIAPVLVLFYGTIILFGIEYDKDRSSSWKNKEKKIIEMTYSKFVKNYHHNNKENKK